MPVSPPVHRPSGALSDDARKRAYDAGRPSRSAVYGHRWRSLRAAYLASLTTPFCECGCGRLLDPKPGQIVVDHRTPHNGDPRLIFAWKNLQALTKPCHDRKTAARDGGFGNPFRNTAGA